MSHSGRTNLLTTTKVLTGGFLVSTNWSLTFRICIMRAGHSLYRKSFSLETFREAPHVAVAAVEFSADPVDTWLQEVGHPRHVAVTVPHYIEALHLVAETELIAVIPERLVRAHTSALNLVTKVVPLDVGTFDEYLLHSARTHADLGCTWLRQLIKSLCLGIDHRGHRIESSRQKRSITTTPTVP
jgi:DNA-binding transcriptional LysR family regulator